MARTPTRAPTRAAAATEKIAARAAATRATTAAKAARATEQYNPNMRRLEGTTAAVPMPATARGTPAAQLSPNQQRMAAAGSNFVRGLVGTAQPEGPDFLRAMQAARAAPMTQPTPAPARQTQPLPPSAGRAVPPTVARGLGAVQQAANQQRMAAKTGAPLPSGMSIGGGQPTPPSRTGGGMPTMAGGAGGMKKGGKVKKMAKGGSVSSASKRGDGCATKGKTKGRFV